MSDINYKLDYLSETKQRIKKAIINKGVEVSNTDTFRSYADKINNISGGSSADIIEAIVDESALPIESGKKVVIADIQATGQGAGALMPFDIVPYEVNGEIYGITRLPDGRVLMGSTKQENNSSPHTSVICEQIGDKWECKYTTLKLPGGLYLNDKIALLYDFAQTKGNVNYPEPFQWGSSGKYINLKTLTIDSITFDETIPENIDSNYVTRYFLTYDSKYLWGVQMNTAKQITTNSTVDVPLWLYSVNVAEDGTVSATKKTESTVTITTYSEHIALLSLNHYGICVGTDYSSYSSYYFGTNTMYAEYDETANSITHNTANAFWNSNSYLPITYTKEWVLVKKQSSSPYPLNFYKGNWHSAEKISADIPTCFSGFPYGSNNRGINRIGNLLFYDYTTSYSSSGTMDFVKVPVDKAEPTADDFVVSSVPLNYEFACFLNEQEYLQTRYDYHTALPLLKNINGSTTTYDPQSVPVMLLDDGTGYFYKNDGKALNQNSTVEVITPVNGSYNNGTVLKTLSYSNQPYFYQQVQWSNSSESGKGYRFGTLPMNYINEGNSFVFHNDTASSSSSSYNFTLFQSTDTSPQNLSGLHTYRGVRVSQNKAYITSYWSSSTNLLNEIIVVDGAGMHTYQSEGPSTTQGVYFEFEGDTYSYPLMKRLNYYGKQDNEYLKLHFDSETMVCTIEKLGNTEMDYLNQMGQYVTATDMSKSNPYPPTSNNSLYNMPVITKDGKYFVGLAGNHTTHYSKIEKSPEGLPMLNVYEFPTILKNLLYEQEILYFEAYYPSGFGIQLANGTFLLCEYEQGLDVDLNITTYTPAHSYTFDSWNQCLMHFTSHKHYWYFSAGTTWSGGSVSGYAGCGRREDLPSTYQKKVYSMKHSFAGSDHITGYLTGTYKEDENKNIIAEVKTLLG